MGRVAKVAKFQTLSFSGDQSCQGCKISDFIVLRISRLRGLQRLQNFRLDHFQDIKVEKVAKFTKI